MKLSNKVLLGFFGFGFIYLTAAFIELRLSGIPNFINDKNGIAESADIPAVTHIILSDFDERVNIIGSDRPRLEVRSFTGGVLNTLEYEVSGDTITFQSLPTEEKQKRIWITVFVPPTTLKGITVNASVAHVQKLQQSVLVISQNEGRIWMDDNKINRINIEQSNQSFLNVAGSGVDTVFINSNRSEVFIAAPISVLQGSIKNMTNVNINNVREIQLSKDESSKLNVH